MAGLAYGCVEYRQGGIAQVIETVLAASAGGYLRFEDLGLSDTIVEVGGFALRWYSLAYIAGIAVGWWYLMKLIQRPGSPIGRNHVDDLVFWSTVGILLGGRVGYILFYQPQMLGDPLQMLRLWDGGMSFHGGVIGVSLGLIHASRRNGLDWLRVHDYVACCVPFGLFFGRLANFVNGELWGKPTTVPWGIVFPRTGMDVPRHPSQLYEALLEGVVLCAVLAYLFWRTQARYQPGKLVGTFLMGYGLSRYVVEFFRQADAQYLDHPIFGVPGLQMGQMLTLPMIFGGLYLVVTASRRRQRVEPIAGSESVA